ncbi:5-methyltetrahydropteroyltriglutamate--homocysteine S-methyltransferase [Arthrobacter monumenti]
MPSPISTPFPSATIVGYPRIGRRRELKRAVESYWAGSSDAATLQREAADLRHNQYARLAGLGLDAGNSSIPASFSFYDQVLDTAVAVGAVPQRFAGILDDDGGIGLDAYFTLARGNDQNPPLELTKWFDSNYHYLVPEIGRETTFRYANSWVRDHFVQASDAGFTTRPTLIGPVTFLLLSKAAEGAGEGFRPLSRLDDLLPVYQQILEDLSIAGVQWVQLEEPALVADQPVDDGELAAAVERAYRTLTDGNRPQILVTTPYGSAGNLLPVLAGTDIEALHIDVFKGTVPDASALQDLGSTALVAGLVDGHNIWKADLEAAAGSLARLEELAGQIAVSTSTSLLHVPYDADDEQQLDPALHSWLAFADQKVAEVVALSRAIGAAGAIDAEITAAAEVLASRPNAAGVRRAEVRHRTAALAASDFRRADYAVREAAQAESLNLPPLPTTTTGSFPQTSEIRSARALARKGELGADEYTQAMQVEIKRVIDLQEDLGFDVLVHGEAERNDMVQYFAEHLDGFEATTHGWVQSYGSRCTRPAVLWGDVSRPAPITVPWSVYAQSLTNKPVKGMLTGPVTILAWSFVRDDQPQRETANQVALALRDEITDLEAASIPIVQVDEPALRELLPLRRADQADYLDWSVNAFRLATSGAAAATQVHTHLCYSEFGAVIGAIDALDADVTSIEAARSKMEVVTDLRQHGFGRGVGPGVYDIHSPRVPSADEVRQLLQSALDHVPASQLWVNPDCGLKTRGYAEVTASLRHLVQAAVSVRESLVPAV